MSADLEQPSEEVPELHALREITRQHARRLRLHADQISDQASRTADVLTRVKQLESMAVEGRADLRLVQAGVQELRVDFRGLATVVEDSRRSLSGDVSALGRALDAHSQLTHDTISSGIDRHEKLMKVGLFLAYSIAGLTVVVWPIYSIVTGSTGEDLAAFLRSFLGG